MSSSCDVSFPQCCPSLHRLPEGNTALSKLISAMSRQEVNQQRNRRQCAVKKIVGGTLQTTFHGERAQDDDDDDLL